MTDLATYPPVTPVTCYQEEQPLSNGNACNGGAKASLLSVIKSGDWLDAQNLPSVEYVVDGLLPEGFTLLVGAPKAGKSWLVAAIVLAAASGWQVLGQRVLQRPVLYLALEDGDRRLQYRTRKLMQGQPIPSGFLYVTRLPDGVTVPELVREWINSLPLNGMPPVVVIDTLGKARPDKKATESDYQFDYRVGGVLKSIADDYPGSAVVAVHHDRKAEAVDFVDSVSGTNGLAGSADTILVIRRDRHSTNAVIHLTGRDVMEAEYAATFDDGLWTLAGASFVEARTNAAKLRAQIGAGDSGKQIADLIAVHGPMTTKQIAALMPEHSYEAVKQALHRAIKANRLDRTDGTYLLPLQAAM
jgi:RecA-family ATPase